MLGCPIGVCENHLKGLLIGNNETYIVWQGNVEQCNLQDIIGNKQEGVSNNTNNNSNNNVPERNQINNDGNNDREFWVNTPTIAGLEDDDYLDGLEASNEAHAAADIEIGVTNANTHELDFVLQESEEVCRTPLYKLLNKHGYLLIQKKHKLCLNKRNQQFIEKIVATAPENAVPTIYAKGMLFADSFFSINIHLPLTYDPS